MPNQPEPQAFAEEWVSAWNAHDIERILSHYAEDIVFLSPVAERRLGNGRVNGRAALRNYWSAGLAAQPDLRFKLREVLAGCQAMTVIYENHRGQTAAETFEFGSDAKVVRSFACYSGGRA